MMLHGFAGWADNLRSTFALGENRRRDHRPGVAPTWGRSVPGFDDDVRYLAWRTPRHQPDRC
jgi:hypothetical protein